MLRDMEDGTGRAKQKGEREREVGAFINVYRKECLSIKMECFFLRVEGAAASNQIVLRFAHEFLCER